VNIDPEILLGLQNSRQNQSSLELQREILTMQKLQVLNQVRISQGLPPLAELPKPPAPPEDSIIEKIGLWICILMIIGLVLGGIYFASVKFFR
jgi:hypothetical protein